jgi:FdhE protein
MTTAGTALEQLRARRKDWAPWLAVVGEVLRETEMSEWDAAVPAAVSPQHPAIPLLAGVPLAVQTSSIRRLLKRLIRTAAKSGTPKMSTLEAALHANLDCLSLFKASLCQDTDRVKELASVRGADADALHAVIALVPLPLLHACGRRWRSSISESWVEPYCPICGSWPVFAEERGIERSRYFRCGRCGGEWHARCLLCPYCTLNDHDALVSLVPEAGRSHGVIEACTRCLGYVKTFPRLQGCSPASVLLDDLASADLDVAAFAHGYSRPPGAGYPLEVTLTDGGARRRFFGWTV